MNNYDGGEILGIYKTLEEAKEEFIKDLDINKFCIEQHLELEELEQTFEEYRAEALENLFYSGEGDWGYFETKIVLKEVEL